MPAFWICLNCRNDQPEFFAPPYLKVLHQEDTPAPAWKRFIAGTCTGALGAVSSNPFDLIKTRMQVGPGWCH
jgi:hypothetical protein